LPKAPKNLKFASMEQLHACFGRPALAKSRKIIDTY